MAVPVASFTKSASSGNAPFTIVFTSTSTGSPTSYLWNWGEYKSTTDEVNYTYWTTSTTSPTITKIFYSPGQYQVKLTATNASGNSTSASQTVTVIGFTAASDRSPANSIFRTKVNTLPVHSQSATWVSNTFKNSDSYGIQLDIQCPYNIVDNSTPTQYLTSIEVPSTSDNIAYPIPSPGLLDPNTGDYDQSLKFYGKDNNYYYEFYRGIHASNDTWSASRANAYNSMNNTMDPTRTRMNTGILPFTYDEAMAGTINHMLQGCVSWTGGTNMWPWFDTANNGRTGYAPLGAIFRLKASYNVDSNIPKSTNPIGNAVAHALQDYGCFLTDMHNTEGRVLIKGHSDFARMGGKWDAVGICLSIVELGTNILSQCEFVNQSSLMVTPLSLAVSTTPPSNQAPISNAGPDQAKLTGNLVTLNGTGSSDPDGNTPLTYYWTLATRPSGSAAALSSRTVSSPTFTADLAGTYIISLVVTDSLGLAGSADTVTITVTSAPPANVAPIANAGVDQSVVVTTQVSLNGSASSDPDGNLPLTYTWSLARPTGSTAVLTSTTASNPKFTADIVGTYTVSLVVKDSLGLSSASDSVVITVTAAPPVGTITKTVTYEGAYTIETYTGQGNTTWTAPTGVTEVAWLVVAGGGGGGCGGSGAVNGYCCGGGGGAGGSSQYIGPTVPGTVLYIAVGAGGDGGTPSHPLGWKGENSVFGILTCTGGGYGGSGIATASANGGAGGSGGGAAGRTGAIGGVADTYGFAGGNADSPTLPAPAANAGSGGGGRSGPGSSGNGTVAGAGGAGYLFTITSTIGTLTKGGNGGQG